MSNSKLYSTESTDILTTTDIPEKDKTAQEAVTTNKSESNDTTSKQKSKDPAANLPTLHFNRKHKDISSSYSEWLCHRKELANTVKPYLANYLYELGVTNLNKNFHCINPAHNDSNPSMTYYSDTHTVYCHGCGFSGNIFNVYAAVNNMPINKALFDEIFEKYGLLDSFSSTENKLPIKPKITPLAPPKDAKKELVDRSADINSAIANLHLTDYWQKRGFTLETAQHFRMGYALQWKHPDFNNTPPSDRLILPTGDGVHSYLARDVHNDGNFKVIKVGGSQLFNLEGLNGEYIIVNEGEFDAVSTWQVGFHNVIGLGGVGNKHKFISAISNMDSKPKFIIIALDNDKSGLDAANWIHAELDKLGIFSMIVNEIFGDFKDANGLLIHDELMLKNALEIKVHEAIESAKNWTPPPVNQTVCEEKTMDIFDDTLLPNLFKQHKFYEAEKVAISILDEMLKNEISIRSVNRASVLYAAGLCKNSDDLAAQASFAEFRQKCKDTKGIVLTGFHGLDDNIELYYSKLNSIRQQIIDEENERFLQEKKAFIKSQIEEGKITAPLPLDKIEAPDGLYFDCDRNLTLELRNDGEEAVRFNSINLITKRLNNVDTGKQKVEVATLKANSKHWNYLVAEREVIATNHKITSLATDGLDVISRTAANMVNYLNDFENLNYDLIPTIKTVNQTGWRGDDFVYPNTDGEYQLDDSIKPQLDKIFEVKGDKSNVTPLIKRIKENDVANVNLGAALAAPLVNVFNCDNIVVHNYSLAGSGKTALNYILASLFFNPRATGAIPNANATQSGLEYHFAGRHDLPAFIEDLNSVSKHDKKFNAIVKQLPYQFGNKNGRLRATAKGGLRNLIDFRGSLLTNDEKPLTEDTSAAGGKRRVIELKCDNEMFDSELVGELYESIEDNYGLFGREWIEIIQQNKDVMKDMYKQIRKELQNSFTNKVPRHIHMLTACLIANIFFDCKVLDMKFEEAQAKELDCLQRILLTLPDKTEIADFERAKPIIIDWIFRYMKYFEKDDGGTEEETYPADDDRRRPYDEYGVIKKNFIAIYPTTFKDMLRSYDFSPEMIIKQLADDGFITRDGDHLEKRVRIKGNQLKRMIVIDKSKLSDE